MQNPSKKEQLTTLEARKYLGEGLGRGKPLAYDTLRSYKIAGYLHPKRARGGHEMLYDRDELDKFLRGESFAGPRLVMPAMMAHFETYVRSQLHLEPNSEFLEQTPAFAPIPAQRAILLQVPTDTLAVRRYLLQSGRQPGEKHWTRWRTSENWYNPDLVDQTMLEQMQHSPAFDTMLAIRERFDGLTVRNVLIRVRSRLPTTQEVKLLEMQPQHPVLEMDRVSSAGSGQIVMIHHLVFVADRCEIEWNQENVNLWEVNH